MTMPTATPVGVTDTSVCDPVATTNDGSAKPTGDIIPARGHWRGNLDVFRRDSIEGWAQDEAQPDRRLVLRILDNGVPLGEIQADSYRADLEAAGIGDGRHAFSFRVPGGLSPDTRHLIEVLHADDGRPLRGSPAVLEAASASALVMARSALPAPWRGTLETVTRERLEGWAWDERTDEPLALVILDNGEMIARVLANRYRRDLLQAGIGSGRHGFSLHMPGGLSPLTRHVIQVLGEADGCEMPTSPVVIEASSGFDAALEHALSSAVAALATPAQRERVLTLLAAQMERLLQQSAEADAGREARLIHRQLTRRWGKVEPADTAGSAPRPRALIVDDWMPAADQDAGSAAILSHARALQALGYEVSFVAAEELSPSVAAIAALESQGIRCCHAPYYASVEEVLRRQRDCFDVIYLHRVGNAARYMNLARRYATKAYLVYSVADLHHLRLARQAKIEGRQELLAQSHRVCVAECAAARAADAVITHSAVEAAWLSRTVRGVNVHVVPWAVPVRPSATPWQERRGIAFIGNFAFAPNLDAARFLAEEIMPRVRREDSSIECLLVGSRMPPEIRRLQAPGIVVLGHVPELGSLFERVRLTVAPLRYGAGVKGKVLESLAAGVPCVMSPVAAEGIELPATLAAIGSNTEELATQILRLYSSDPAGNGSMQAALSFIGERFTEAEVAARLKPAIEGRRAAAGAHFT
jgi:glycosyltransferase involved in cell wall biosynthesis